MADIRQITINGVTYTIKDQSAREAAAEAQSAATAANNTAITANNTANGAKSDAQAANSAAQAANSAAQAAQTDVNNLAGESLAASYNTGNESLVLSKGISV